MWRITWFSSSTPLPPVALPKARLEALKGAAEPELDDDLTRFLTEDTLYTPGMSADDYLEAIQKRWDRKGHK